MRRMLVVCDLYPDPGETAAATQTRLPQLPALSELLRLGREARRNQDWRAGLAADLGVPALALVAPAQVAACAAGLAPDIAVCMAEPVHLFAGMASVHLHPAGLLYLDADSMAELRLQFAREFGARHQALFSVGDGLLLAAPEAQAANAREPAQLLGSTVEASRSSDPQLRALRRLGAEVEMWLPGLALNRDRERRGELPVTTLWFWGGGKGALPGVAARDTPEWHQAYGGDPFLHGIWRSIGGDKVQMAIGWNKVNDDSALIAVSALRSSAGAPRGSFLEQLESEWFAPALRDLHNGRVTALGLRIGGQRWDFGLRPRARWWQPRSWRSRPWWQELAG